MAKKVYKKAARNTQKEKRFPTSSPKTVSQEIVPTTGTVVDDVSVTKEAQTCPHLDKGANLGKFCKTMSSLESLKFVTCDYCRYGVADQKTKKGKDKPRQIKGNHYKLESKSLWVCLECGHFSCGDVALPKSHTAQHAKQYRHPLFFKFSNPDLRFCFSCNTSIPVQWSYINGEYEDVLSEFVKLVEARSLPKTRVDVGANWFEGGSITPCVKSVNTFQYLTEGKTDGYMVKGLVNLGNTCFFNSVLQNLLAMDKLRDHFLKLMGLVGPVTASLKNLFVEMSGNWNVINPRFFFVCFCAKAPQFKGFQQHDSHELLRCLLEELCSEESRWQKHASSFVDALFGGQISSRVSCLECGHSSVVYEPYLDLSLPLPTKRSSSEKTTSKKSTLDSKREGKFLPKPKNVSDSSAGNGDESSGAREYMETSVEKSAAFLCDSTQSEYVLFDAIGDKNDSSLQNGIDQIKDSTVALSESLLQPVTLLNGYDEYTTSSSNVFSSDCSNSTMASTGHDTTCEQTDSFGSEEALWLDYLAPYTYAVEDTRSPNRDSSVFQDSGNSNDVLWDDEPLTTAQESEVLYLHFKEISSTCIQEPSDCDGVGLLFDELEPVAGPTGNPLFNRIEGSESDPDEVDDTDSPLSVEKCLAYFTTPELLVKNEHAWECDQCSKFQLLEQKRLLKNKLQNTILNEEVSIAVVSDSDENLALCNRKSESCQDTESCNVNGLTDICENENDEKKEHESDRSEDDEVDSEGVKVVRDASKRILISKAPPVLTIHLKRFCQDARGRLSKLNGHVNFSDTFDLKPYMDPSCCKDRDTYKYRLIGVVEHSGTMRGGHYVAYVRRGAKGAEENDNGLWYYASDAYVHEVSLDEVLRCEAYILFYEEM